MSLPKSLFFSRVFLNKKGVLEEFQVESLRPYKDSYVLKLKGIDSIAEAREIVGQEILLPEEELDPLDENHYYLFQIVGCSVLSKSRQRIGKVIDFVSVPDNDLLVVSKGKREIYIPFTKGICVQVNVDKREIIIDPPEGLLELNEI